MDRIAKGLEADGILTGAGKTKWWTSTINKILRNEKYIGDALLQKTYTINFLNKTRVKNNDIVPQYYVEGNHEAIIPNDIFLRVQEELVRRRVVKTSANGKKRSYSCNHCFAQIVICGECGEMFRRIHWNNRGCKSIVWRCISRFDYGKKYCHDSPAVDEQQLQQAILRVINGAMSEKPALVRQVTENLQVVIRPSRGGELTITDIDHQLETLTQEFDATFAAAATGNAADYSERFKTILAQQAKLKAKRTELERQQAEDTELANHMEEAADIMGQAGTAITEWNERNIRDLVASVRILSKEEILVRLKSGIEKIERLQK